MKLREHQLESPRIERMDQDIQVLQANLASVAGEVIAARGDKHASLAERLDYIMQNAGGGGRGGGSGGGLISYEEIVPPAGTTELTLSQPYQMGRERLLLYYNGVLLTPGPGNDYEEVDGRRIRLSVATVDGDRFTALVMANPQPEVFWFRQQVVGQDGQTVFELAQPYQMGVNGILVFKNGILQTEGADNDYVELDEQHIQMTVPATSEDIYLFIIPISRNIVTWWRRQVIVNSQTDPRIDVGRYYAVGSNQLQVYRNGVLQRIGDTGDYVEIDSRTIEFRVPFEDDEIIQFVLPESGIGQQVGALQNQLLALEQQVSNLDPAGHGEKLTAIETQVADLINEIAEARTDQFSTLGARLEYILQNAGSGGTGGSGEDPASSETVAQLQRQLAKTDFKLELLRRAYAHYAHEACDILSDDTGIDYVVSTGITYDPSKRQVVSESGGVLTTVEIPVAYSPNEVLLLWDGSDVQAEISRDNGTSYEPVSNDTFIPLTLGAGGTSIRLRFTLAPGGVLNHWGLIWR